ncbi:MAG: cupin domain-containing protein [Elusimicrobiota bacterium]
MRKKLILTLIATCAGSILLAKGPFVPTVGHLSELSHQYPLTDSLRSEWLFDSGKGSVVFTQFKGDVKIHYHKSHDEVVVLLQGEGTLTIDSVAERLRERSVYRIPKGIHHSATCSEGYVCKIYSVFSPKWDPKKPDRTFID